MRIALLMSGHARTYDRTHWGWYDYLMSEFDTDVYMSLWDTTGPRHMAPDGRDFQSGVEESALLNYSDICEIWQPTAIEVHPYALRHQTFLDRAMQWYEVRDRLGLRTIDRPLANFSMYYQWNNCFTLMEETSKRIGVEYDMVIRSRPDILLSGPIPPEAFLDPKYVYVPTAGGWGGDEISDYMTIGTVDQIRKYCDLYNQLDDIFEWAVQDGDFTKALYPHRLFHFHIINSGMQYKQIDIPCEIVRP